MSSEINNKINSGRAERSFRSAFERLKSGHPTRLQSGSPVSQNNVAKEAGCDPSALKKSRYPDLINEIKAWKNEQVGPEPTAQQSIVALRLKRRSLHARIEEIENQRDRAISQLLEADSKILELINENEQLRSLLPSSNTRPFPDIAFKTRSDK